MATKLNSSFKSRIEAKDLLKERLDVMTVKSSGLDVEYRSSEDPNADVFLSSTLMGQIISSKIYARVNETNIVLKTKPTLIGKAENLKGKIVVVNCSCKGNDVNIPCVFTVILQDRVYHLSSQTNDKGLIDFIVIIHFN